MWTYVARRLLQGLLVLWLVSLLIFSLVRILPGDAILMQLDQAAAPTPEVLDRARQELGLDRPFLTQYRIWMAGAAPGRPRPLADQPPARDAGAPEAHQPDLPSGRAVDGHRAADRPAHRDPLRGAAGHREPTMSAGSSPSWACRCRTSGWPRWPSRSSPSGSGWMPPIGFAPLWKDPGAQPEPAPDPGRSSSGRGWPRCPCA